MLAYKYHKIQPIDILTLHVEKLTFRSQVKGIILRFLSTGKLLFKADRGPAMVAERLISNLKGLSIQSNDEINWILNVNTKLKWESLVLESEKIILGPNIEFEMSFVKEKVENFNKAIILVPSEWVIPVLKRRLYWFKGKFAILRSDLDLNFWKPAKNSKPRHVLIYRKDDHFDGDFHEIVRCCKELGLKYKEITYGRYSQKEFRRYLKKSFFAVWLGTTESQGIALLECWSTNVPTLVRERNEYLDTVTGALFASSSAPYLTKECGDFFTMDNFDCITLANFVTHSKTLEPRKYILENYSKSRICGELKRLLESFES